MPYLSEIDRLRRLGQTPPLTDSEGKPIDYEGPDDYVDPEEQRQLFPRGLPPVSKRGALADQAASSRLTDLGNQVMPANQAPERGTTSAAIHQVDQQQQRPQTWMTGAPEAYAHADSAQRDMAAEGELAEGVGKLVKTLAMAGAGGAAAGGAGAGAAGGEAGAGAAGAAGAEAGAGGAAGGAGAGFGANFSAGYTGGMGSGSGWGGFAGRVANAYGGGGYAQQADSLSRLSDAEGGGEGGGMGNIMSMMKGKGGMMGGGGGGKDKQQQLLDWLQSIANQKHLAALQAAGVGPYSAGLETAYTTPWSQGS